LRAQQGRVCPGLSIYEFGQDDHVVSFLAQLCFGFGFSAILRKLASRGEPLDLNLGQDVTLCDMVENQLGLLRRLSSSAGIRDRRRGPVAIRAADYQNRSTGQLRLNEVFACRKDLIANDKVEWDVCSHCNSLSICGCCREQETNTQCDRVKGFHKILLLFSSSQLQNDGRRVKEQVGCQAEKME
jgi:hypothetical protein